MKRNVMGRISSEKRTVSKMIQLYCRLNHRQETLCPECKELLDYAMMRLDKCPYGEAKTVCSQCETHCYRMEKREKIKMIMRFSGPRMLFYHPYELLVYLFRKRR